MSDITDRINPYGQLIRELAEEMNTRKPPGLTTDPIPEGSYLMTYRETESRVTIRDTMQGQWPSTVERRMVHFDDQPRFPWDLRDALEAGATFRNPPPARPPFEPPFPFPPE